MCYDFTPYEKNNAPKEDLQTKDGKIFLLTLLWILWFKESNQKQFQKIHDLLFHVGSVS